MAEVVTRGQRFHVQRLGAGPRTAVFVHGLVMDNLSSWFFTVATPVARVADVVLYDLRGHGRSERPRTGYRVEDMVADLDALLDALGLAGRRVELIGNSFGGLLAIAYALAHPERVGGLALVDANMSDEHWGPGVAEKFRATGRERDLLIARYAHQWAGRHSERKSTRLARSAEDLVYHTSLVDDLAASPPLTDDDLRRIECPVLALYGDRSELRDRAERLERVLPGCDVRFIPDCSHLLLWEATERVGEALVEWMSRSGEAGGLTGSTADPASSSPGGPRGPGD
ncbi:MAG TPA: alpha/beta hydrolase [Gemmatimonadota bacterium]|nr:alpha/beta hydrolase [Gemmatimonadota bacterium]